MQEQSKNMGNIVIGVIIALIIGGIVGFAIGRSKDDNHHEHDMQSQSVSEDNPRVDTKAADLRVALSDALTEHVDLASPALRDVFDGAKSTEGATAALDANSVEIATAVDSIYPGTKDDFLKLWRSHIGFFVDYTTGAKAGDKAKMNQAKKNLEGYASEAAAFFSKANPNLPKDALQAGLTEHFTQVIDIVNAYGAGDYQKSYELQREASDHMSMTAKTLSGGIVAQYPDKF